MSGESPAPRRAPRREQCGVARAAAALLAQALAGDDAEASGLRADEVLADAERAAALLGAPDAWLAARHAVVQRYGRVGALMVLAYEDRWQRRHTAGPFAGRAPSSSAADCCPWLDDLVDLFDRLDAGEVARLLAEIDAADGVPADDERAEAHRWLHATYAVAARDRTDSAHRAYMEAFDRVVRLVRPRLAS